MVWDGAQHRIPAGNPPGSSSLQFSSPLVGSAAPLVGFTVIQSLSELLGACRNSGAGESAVSVSFLTQ